MIKKNTYKKGFSMAELLLALLVISIVLSASMPTVIRGAKADREKIWRWTGANTSTYFGKNSNQRVLTGSGEIPSYDFVTKPEDYAPELNAKVSVFKSNDKSVSHIDILTEGNGGNKQAARIFADENNIALGLDVLKYNSSGLRNTGIGNGVLASINDEAGTNEQDLRGNDNTGIGYEALARNTLANNNTAIGSGSGSSISGGNVEDGSFGGNNNTLIGYGTGASSSVQDKNTIIGSGACSELGDTADRNICIGYNASGALDFAGVNSDRLIIGSDNRNNDVNYYPLITGFLDNNGTNFDKSIDFNVKNLKINTFDGETVPFLFQSGKGFNAEYTGSNFYTSKNIMKYYFKKDNEESYTGIETFVDNANEIKFKIHSYNTTDSFVNINNDKLLLNFTKENNKQNVDLINLSTITFHSGEEGYPGNCYTSFALSYKGLFTSTSGPRSSACKNTMYSDKPIDVIAEEEKLRLNGSSYVRFFNYDSSLPIELTSGADINRGGIHIASKMKLGYSTNVLSGFATDVDSIKVNTIEINGDEGSLTMYAPIGTESETVRAYDGGAVPDPVITIGEGIISADKFYDDNYGSSTSVGEKFQELARRVEDLARSCACISSDIRLKNVKGDFKAGLKEIAGIKVKNFTYKNDEKQEPHVGVIAQDLQKIFPRSVFKEPKTGYLNIKTEEIFFASINAVKQLYSKFLDLTAKVTGLDEKLLSLQKENAELKAKSEEFERRLDNLEADD